MNDRIKDIGKKYDDWVRKIAKEKNSRALVKHFREHVGSHYVRYDRSKAINFDAWIIDIFNFMHILEKKALRITKEDMLFKLALHYRNHNGGPKPNFDVSEFIKNYKGRFKKFDELSLKRINKLK